MRLLPKASPPRLLQSVAPETAQEISRAPQSDSGLSVPGASFFSNNGRAILFGILLVAAAFSTIGIIYSRQQAAIRQDEARRKLLPAATQSISASQRPDSPPAPILVQMRADLLHVTAISLGHPRLAIINGQQVAEGDRVTVHTPTASVALTLKVLRIGDGRIDLSDGTQEITARLELPGSTPSRP